MGIIDFLRGWRNAPASANPAPQASLENPSMTLADIANAQDWGGDKNRFGPPINEHTSMAVSAVYRCVTLRAGTIAGLPLKVYKRTKTGREEAHTHRLAKLFRTAPFPGRPLTAFCSMELAIQNMDLWGNSYQIIRYDQAARVIGLEAAMPWNVEVLRQAGRNIYRCKLEDNTVEIVDQDDMIHIAGVGYDGIQGVSKIQHFARDSIALSKLMETSIGKIHENAARPSGVLSLPNSITPDGMKRLRNQFADLYTGRDNYGRVMFVDSGSEFKSLQITPLDLGTLESRRFQIAEITRWFGVPLHLVNEVSGTTSWGSGISELTQGWKIFGLDPDLSRIEAELNYKLFANGDYYVEFARDALLAMDPAKTAEVVRAEIASGVLLPNEARAMKNRPPVEHGDKALVNSATVSLDSLFEPKPEPQPAPVQEPADEKPPADDGKEPTPLE